MLYWGKFLWGKFIWVNHLTCCMSESGCAYQPLRLLYCALEKTTFFIYRCSVRIVRVVQLVRVVQVVQVSRWSAFMICIQKIILFIAVICRCCLLLFVVCCCLSFVVICRFLWFVVVCHLSFFCCLSLFVVVCRKSRWSRWFRL